MENDQTITKDSSRLRLLSNLADYKREFESFNIEKFRSEVEWFDETHINAAYNAVDRHVKAGKGDKVAMYWEGDENKTEKYTFNDLYKLTNKFANVLKELGVKKGDRVFIFLPRIPALFVSFLGVLKTGAVAGTMFSAFGPQAIADRLKDSGARFLVTDSELAERVYQVKKDLPALEKVIIVDRSPKEDFEIDYKQKMEGAGEEFDIEKTSKDDLAFMLYTSGTTGKPKGVVHAHNTIIQQHMTAKWALDLHDEDIYWCTADPGWVTGIAYEILGSWSNAATEVIFAGRFDAGKWYEIIQKYKVSVWYTAPTAIRMLKAAGDDLIKKYDLSSLRYLASVGEPLNPEAVLWSNEIFGLPFHDNWWQTEGGGILIANYPTMPIKPGSMGKPIPGVHADIVDDNGNPVKIKEEGNLVLKPGWPAMMRMIWNNESKYKSYFTPPAVEEKWKETEDKSLLLDPKTAPWYYSGDKAFKDEDGYFWFIGRSDDVIKTAGERVGPFEVESALIEHPGVVEAGVIGKPDELRGEIIKAFVVLEPGVEKTDQLKEELGQFVKKHLAGHAYPREVEFVDKLPKTRSGKIMRRLLKAKELGQPIGDTSTLEEY
ncbi:MAG: acetate--CoA ligase [Candidatus Woykebacteria bacterium RBG_13_40_15]|uniref:acetate--CoA ligase n=1 Tax=Candidatus Woykebacteria bacterium RBG_13_40_15 TaxID=1802593 RepID=A0A1G1W7F3_9BACT|nr:MAG: acetate--CoA ligase [Candidatus Woykebacteria bacterium RBG_13_40_15]